MTGVVGLIHSHLRGFAPENPGNLLGNTDFRTGWTLTNVTLTPYAALAPDGTMTAARLMETTATGTHSIQITITNSATTQYWASLFVCPILQGNRRVDMECYNPGITNGAYYIPQTTTNLGTLTGISGGSDFGSYGSYVSNDAQQPDLLPSSWLRFKHLFTTDTANVLFNIYLLNSASNNYAGSASNGALIWRPRLALATDGYA